MKTKDMKTYYKDRAKVYDQSMYFKKPERNKEIKEMGKLQRKLFENKVVIEAACGPGYWTKIISKVAKKIFATDAINEVLNEARMKKYSCPVEFTAADAFDLPFKKESFDAGLANFWISHILKKDLKGFLNEFHNLLKPGSKLFFCDNVNGQGTSGKFVKIANDTFRIRELNDNQYKVIKNYYTKKELIELFSPYARNSKVNVVIGKWAWWAWYETK